jgi:hypothetical protein
MNLKPPGSAGLGWVTRWVTVTFKQVFTDGDGMNSAADTIRSFQYYHIFEMMFID